MEDRILFGTCKKGSPADTDEPKIPKMNYKQIDSCYEQAESHKWK